MPPSDGLSILQHRDAKSEIPHPVPDAVIEALNSIHDRMWYINGLCRGGDSIRLRDRKVRSEIVNVIRECAGFDAKAARFIGAAIR